MKQKIPEASASQTLPGRILQIRGTTRFAGMVHSGLSFIGLTLTHVQPYAHVPIAFELPAPECSLLYASPLPALSVGDAGFLSGSPYRVSFSAFLFLTDPCRYLLLPVRFLTYV